MDSETVAGSQQIELKNLSPVADRVIKTNLAVVKDKYSSNPFHDPRHSATVVRRSGTIAEETYTAYVESGLKQSLPNFMEETDIEDTQISASAHDRYLDELSQFEEEKDVVVDGETTHVWILKLKREVIKPGENEAKSADENEALLDEQVDSNGIKIYSDQRKMRQRKAIMATVPGYDPDLKTVTQPNLGKDATVVEFATAAGDLGGCAVDGPEQFIYEGNAIFREDVLAIKIAQNDDYLYLIHIVPHPEILTETQAKGLVGVILSHSAGQEDFALGREQATRDFLQNWPLPIATALLGKVFTKFKESAKGAKDKYEERVKMVKEAGDYRGALKMLFADLGYKSKEGGVLNTPNPSLI